MGETYYLGLGLRSKSLVILIGDLDLAYPGFEPESTCIVPAAVSAYAHPPGRGCRSECFVPLPLPSSLAATPLPSVAASGPAALRLTQVSRSVV